MKPMDRILQLRFCERMSWSVFQKIRCWRHYSINFFLVSQDFTMESGSVIHRVWNPFTVGHPFCHRCLWRKSSDFFFKIYGVKLPVPVWWQAATAFRLENVEAESSEQVVWQKSWGNRSPKPQARRWSKGKHQLLVGDQRTVVVFGMVTFDFFKLVLRRELEPSCSFLLGKLKKLTINLYKASIVEGSTAW